MKKSAFTLVELVIVLAIISFVAAMAIPSLVKYRENANIHERAEHEAMLGRALRQYNAFQGNVRGFTVSGVLSDTDDTDQEARFALELRKVTGVQLNRAYEYNWNPATQTLTIIN